MVLKGYDSTLYPFDGSTGIFGDGNRYYRHLLKTPVNINEPPQNHQLSCLTMVKTGLSKVMA